MQTNTLETDPKLDQKHNAFAVWNYKTIRINCEICEIATQPLDRTVATFYFTTYRVKYLFVSHVQFKLGVMKGFAPFITPNFVCEEPQIKS